MRNPSILRRLLILGCVCSPLFAQGVEGKREWTIMAVGDSITEGGAHPCYRPALARKLKEGESRVTFIGPKVDAGGMRYAGYSGMNAQYIDGIFAGVYGANPADILLIHAGHNYSSEEKPVAGILKATESIINKARSLNPNVIILLAQVIPSGKLPKYSYLPELNEGLAKLAKAQNSAQRPLILVDQTKGFDSASDTGQDMVHPNEQGAEKMATRWLEALGPILAKTPPVKLNPSTDTPTVKGEALPKTAQEALRQASKVVVYKTVENRELKIFVFTPPGIKPGDPRPALLFIHGGGWVNGDPSVHALECLHFSRKGLVTITMSYRLISTGSKVTPADCLADAKSAIRYLRAHADELNLDPNKIVACGGSAGGHLAAALATIPGYDDPNDDTAVSCRPDALLLFYPAFDLVSAWKAGGAICFNRGINPAEFSPALHVPSHMPPTLILAGSRDPISTPESNKRFIEELKSRGVKARFVSFTDRAHELFIRSPDNPHFRAALFFTEQFLGEIGYLQNQSPTNEPEIQFQVIESAGP